MKQKTLLRIAKKCLNEDGTLNYKLFDERIFTLNSSLDSINKSNLSRMKTKHAVFKQRSGDIPFLRYAYIPRSCFICGWKATIHIHHVDGNKTNNQKDNLMPLCPNHHSILHSTLSLSFIGDPKHLFIIKDLRRKAKGCTPLY